LPFANEFAKEEALRNIYQTIKTVIEIDLPQNFNFKKDTVNTALQLLNILSVSSTTSKRSLGSAL
jgi:hypothetical protein